MIYLRAASRRSETGCQRILQALDGGRELLQSLRYIAFRSWRARSGVWLESRSLELRRDHVRREIELRADRLRLGCGFRGGGNGSGPRRLSLRIPPLPQMQQVRTESDEISCHRFFPFRRSSPSLHSFFFFYKPATIYRETPMTYRWLKVRIILKLNHQSVLNTATLRTALISFLRWEGALTAVHLTISWCS